MLSHPNGIALKFFNEAFAKRFGHRIAFGNYGFDSIESMILSVPDTLLIHTDTTRNIKMVKRVFPLEASNQSGSPSKRGGVQLQEQSINWYYMDQNRHEDFADATQKPEQDKAATSSSLNTIELSPQMKKKIIDKVKAPMASDWTKKKPIPWTLAGKIKSLLLANKMGIWVSRFLLVYQVRESIFTCMYLQSRRTNHLSIQNKMAATHHYSYPCVSFYRSTSRRS